MPVSFPRTSRHATTVMWGVSTSSSSSSLSPPLNSSLLPPQLSLAPFPPPKLEVNEKKWETCCLRREMTKKRGFMKHWRDLSLDFSLSLTLEFTLFLLLYNLYSKLQYILSCHISQFEATDEEITQKCCLGGWFLFLPICAFPFPKLQTFSLN